MGHIVSPRAQLVLVRTKSNKIYLIAEVQLLFNVPVTVV